MSHKPMTISITGAQGCGKSWLTEKIVAILRAEGRNVVVVHQEDVDKGVINDEDGDVIFDGCRN